MAGYLDNPDFTDEQRNAGEFLVRQLDESIPKAQMFRDEFEATGGISDPAFDEWYEQTPASAFFANMKEDERRKFIRMKQRFG